MSTTETEAPPEVHLLSRDALALEIVSLKKQNATMHQQLQSMQSRILKLDRDVQSLQTRKGSR